MHQNGWGVPQSDAEAVKLFALAAEQGITEAMLALGRFYAMDFAEESGPSWNTRMTAFGYKSP